MEVGEVVFQEEGIHVDLTTTSLCPLAQYVLDSFGAPFTDPLPETQGDMFM